MVLDHFPVLSLQRLCLTKIALGISNNPEMTAIEKKYDLLIYFPLNKGIDSFLAFHQSDLQFSSWEDEYPSLFMTSPFTNHHLRQWNKPHIYYHNLDTTDYFEFPWCFTLQPKNDLLYAEWNNLILEKISSLSIPKPFHNELLTLVRCIRLEIKKWMLKHSRILRCSEELISFQWKSSGKINYEETAKALIRNEKLDIRTRYALTSFYYLKDDASFLWNKMTRDEKKFFSDDLTSLRIWNPSLERISPFEFNKIARLIMWFDNDIRGDRTPWYSDNYLGLRTLFPKLSMEKKIEWLRYSVKMQSIDNEDLLFCLAHLGANDEKENLFREYPCQILAYFLDWPLQSEFLEVAEGMWSFVSGRIFFFLLHFIIYERIVKEWNDYDYFHLLREFWRQSPIHLKECIKLKNIYQVVMLAIDCGDTSSFYEEEIAKLCANIDYAFCIP
ncbi:uncharacterized protein NPIL_221731 [Nephila pilipes]|uniref:Uncharacterized protein n=1 Tax=Nephila pilipes TaxID=299642 RepID=A0A8X6U8Y8_NEPPI|nr:uncharacterized protein NPIL_584951 [Nephila pilipes]GFT93396.1 uncharacterized protein NPIL_221731 [Nephila pilipes]